MDPIRLNPSVEITGILTCNKKVEGEATEYLFRKSGSFNGHFITKLIVFCEDSFAKEAITLRLCKEGLAQDFFIL